MVATINPHMPVVDKVRNDTIDFDDAHKDEIDKLVTNIEIS